MIAKIYFTLLFLIVSYEAALAQKIPGINSFWLPWDNDQELWDPWTYNNNPFERLTNTFIESFIQFVGVVAVLALILSGIQLIISWWEEEKMKKARKWFIWSLAWVIVSLLAFFIITFINNLDIS